jgi:small nuclear ribonucleoprotein D2
VREVWTETPKGPGGKKQPVNKERFVSAMFVRGDCVVAVLKNPN